MARVSVGAGDDGGGEESALFQGSALCSGLEAYNYPLVTQLIWCDDWCDSTPLPFSITCAYVTCPTRRLFFRSGFKPWRGSVAQYFTAVLNTCVQFWLDALVL